MADLLFVTHTLNTHSLNTGDSSGVKIGGSPLTIRIHGLCFKSKV